MTKRGHHNSGSIDLGMGERPTTPANFGDDETAVTAAGKTGPSPTDGEATRKLSSDEAPAAKSAAQPPPPDDERTRVWRRSSAKLRSDMAHEGSQDAMQDPLTGWLVVIAGPGKGQSVKLGYGMNSVGRGGSARASLNFGDNQISRDAHCTITFDPRGRSWFVSHGQGSNVTYVNDQLVLQPTALEAFAHISIGETTLCFVPFCSHAFDWPDTEGET